MKTSFKILLLGIFNSLIVLIGIYFVGRMIIVNKAESIDEDRVVRSLMRVFPILEDKEKELAKTAADWGQWDDTYQYMADGNTYYDENNLSVEAFEILDVHQVLLVDTTGKIAHSRSFDFDKQEIVAVPEDLMKALQDKKILNLDKNTQKTGLLFLPRPVFIAINPILDSMKEKESRGLFIMVRDVDEAQIEQLEKTLNHSLAFLPLNTATIPQNVYDQITKENNRFIAVPENASLITGYSSIADITGKTDMAIEIEMTREVRTGMTMAVTIFCALSFIITSLLVLANYRIIYSFVMSGKFVK